MPKQQPIADWDVTVFLQQKKFLANLSSFWSSTIEEKLMIAVSSFPELYDEPLFRLPCHKSLDEGVRNS